MLAEAYGEGLRIWRNQAYHIRLPGPIYIAGTAINQNHLTDSAWHVKDSQPITTMYEHRSNPLLPRRQFFARLARNFWFGALILAISLGIGMAGYHVFEGMLWLDAFANASMILSGMGPLAPIQTSAGKLFAGCYALFSGVAFLTSVGVLFAPVAHRFLHRFHLQSQDETKHTRTD